jgi:hypothetical protein
MKKMKKLFERERTKAILSPKLSPINMPKKNTTKVPLK